MGKNPTVTDRCKTSCKPDGCENTGVWKRMGSLLERNGSRDYCPGLLGISLSSWLPSQGDRQRRRRPSCLQCLIKPTVVRRAHAHCPFGICYLHLDLHTCHDAILPPYAFRSLYCLVDGSLPAGSFLLYLYRKYSTLAMARGTFPTSPIYIGV